jgi:glutaconate CoA-transferase subunit B
MAELMSLPEAVSRFVRGHGARARSSARGSGPQAVITDFGILKPMDGSAELQLVGHFENVTPRQAADATGWPLQVAEAIEVLPAPSIEELRVLREMNARTRDST